MTQAVRFHDGQRFVAALAREGRTRLHLVVIDDAGVRRLTVPKDEARYLRPLLLRGKPYPVERAVRKFRAFGRERGITDAAKDELARAET